MCLRVTGLHEAFSILHVSLWYYWYIDSVCIIKIGQAFNSLMFRIVITAVSFTSAVQVGAFINQVLLEQCSLNLEGSHFDSCVTQTQMPCCTGVFYRKNSVEPLSANCANSNTQLMQNLLTISQFP